MRDVSTREFLGRVGFGFGIFGACLVVLWVVWYSQHTLGFLPTALGMASIGFCVYFLTLPNERGQQ